MNRDISSEPEVNLTAKLKTGMHKMYMINERTRQSGIKDTLPHGVRMPFCFNSLVSGPVEYSERGFTTFVPGPPSGRLESSRGRNFTIGNKDSRGENYCPKFFQQNIMQILGSNNISFAAA